MNFKRAKQEHIERLREISLGRKTHKETGVIQVAGITDQQSQLSNTSCGVLPLVQDQSQIRVIKQSCVESAAKASYAAVLGFEDNQFKKQKLDRHDSVISMLHATKEALTNPFEDDSEEDQGEVSCS